jgi:hypothetical protein
MKGTVGADKDLLLGVKVEHGHTSKIEGRAGRTPGDTLGRSPSDVKWILAEKFQRLIGGHKEN